MSVKFKAIRKTQPGVVHGGSKKYYASGISAGEMDLEALTTTIEKMSTISGADIREVLYTLVKVTADGYIVRLGDIGSVLISLRSEGLPNPKRLLPRQ